MRTPTPEAGPFRSWFIWILSFLILMLFLISSENVDAQCCGDFSITVEKAGITVDTSANGTGIGNGTFILTNHDLSSARVRLTAESEGFEFSPEREVVTLSPGGSVTVPFTIMTRTHGYFSPRVCTVTGMIMINAGMGFTPHTDSAGFLIICGTNGTPNVEVKSTDIPLEYGSRFELGLMIYERNEQSGTVLIEVENCAELKAKGIHFDEQPTLYNFSPDNYLFSLSGEETRLQGQERYDVVELKITQQEDPGIVYHRTVILHRERQRMDPAEGFMALLILLIPFISLMKNGSKPEMGKQTTN